MSDHTQQTYPPAPGVTPDAAPAPAPAPAEPPAGTAAPGAADPPQAAAQPEKMSDVPMELPPFKIEGDKAVIDDFLRYVIDVRSSDLHIKTGSPPTIRMSGSLIPLDYPSIGVEEANELSMAMITREKDRVTLEEKGEVDFAYSLQGMGRFRVNIHKQRGSLGIAARRILPGAPDLKDIGVPAVIEQLANEHRGMLLVTGPTSSGKTTTCGAILKHINETRRAHIVTIEDPIEILHKDQMSVVTQREVGQDTGGFFPALRAAMRQDPDVIFVGEIRDVETVGAALQAAETGHFVLATLHTTDAVETINRIVDFFPAHQQKQVRIAVATSLVGTITQRLLPKIGGGRAPAIEVMVNNGRIRDCIIDGEKTHDIHDIIVESGFYGMQTFDQALIKLYQDGQVTLEDAKSAANNPHDFELSLRQLGAIAP